MNILFFWGADYPWDIRIEKFARSLHQDHHHVHLLCRNVKRAPRREAWAFGTIHRLTVSRHDGLNFAGTFPVFLNPVWLQKALNIIRRERIDLIIVRDLPLALSAIAAGRLSGIPVVFDMAENYPALMEDTWKYEPFRLRNVVIRNPKFARLIERLAIHWADRVLVVIDETKKRLIKDAIGRNRVSIVSNTPDLAYLPKIESRTPVNDSNSVNSRFVITYVGGLEFSRGLQTVIKALPRVVEQIPNILFWVIGSGNSRNHLEVLSKDLHVEDHVRFEGLVPFEAVPSILRQSSAGIIPHYITNHTDYTIPNKLFDYMYYQLPVLASACKPIARIIENEACGITFKDTNDLVDGIVALNNPKLRIRMGQNGRKAVVSRYNWNNDSRILSRVINSLV